MTFINKIVKTFLSKEFITFAVIGVVITGIHIFFYAIFNTITHHALSNLLAFIIASFFSYISNTFITYKSRLYYANTLIAVLVYTIKLILNSGLEFVFKDLSMALSIPLQYSNVLIPVMITAVITPLQFLVFNKMFKKTFFLILQSERNI
jgi:putative flippase GtrA